MLCQAQHVKSHIMLVIAMMMMYAAFLHCDDKRGLQYWCANVSIIQPVLILFILPYFHVAFQFPHALGISCSLCTISWLPSCTLLSSHTCICMHAHARACMLHLNTYRQKHTDTNLHTQTQANIHTYVSMFQNLHSPSSP